ncbi:MAG: segregation/condensation protein A, partial [Terracidiphilus sp.]
MSAQEPVEIVEAALEVEPEVAEIAEAEAVIEFVPEPVEAVEAVVEAEPEMANIITVEAVSESAPEAVEVVEAVADAGPDDAEKTEEKAEVKAEEQVDEKSAEMAAAKLAARQKKLDEGSEQSPFSVFVGQVYDGPLDLLLDLIRKQDIDIYDIPIGRITAQFLAYVNQLKASDVDVAGEFIYTASLLIHIKSKMLLPRAPTGPEE